MLKLQKFAVVLFVSIFAGSLFVLKTSALSTYTASEVAQHNIDSSCWMSFENSVYDITSYLNFHDKYMDISAWCGKDMTVDFTTKAGMNVDHNSSSYSLLELYKIGTLSTSTSITNTPIPTNTNSNLTTTPSVSNTESTEDEIYSIEIEGDVMKTLTIQQIADLWKIDSSKLLAEIIRTYNFKNPYTTQTVLGDMRDEYKFSPSQIKDIAEGIKTGSIVNAEIPNLTSTPENSVTSTNTTARALPYNFEIPFFGSIIAYLVTYTMMKKKWGGKFLTLLNFNLIWNSILVITIIPSVIFGIYLTLRYYFPTLNQINFDFLYWHVEGSLVFGTVAIMHLIQRLKQYVLPIKLFTKKS